MAETFEPQKRKRRSLSWEYFNEKDKDLAVCIKCGKEVKTTGGGTTGLIRHLENVHKMTLNPKKQKEQSKAMPDPLEIVSKLAAKDGLSFKTIATSETLRFLYEQATEMTLPISPHTIREHIFKYASTIKSNVKNEILVLKEENVKFTITMDEWSSQANRRYMCVNVHGPSSFWNLGLARIRGTFGAEATLETLEEKLREFGLCKKDVIAVVTDGAAVMKRFGTISGLNHQLCFAHAIHLAVSDVLYKTKSNNVEVNETEIMESDDEDETGISPIEEEIQYKENINDLICKVRKIVKKFKASPKSSEILEMHAGPGRKALLDTRTRWNSMFTMMERFYKLKEALQKTYIDIKENLDVSEEDFQSINEMVEVLEPIKLATEVICQRHSTLIEADVAFKFMMDKLSSKNTEIAINLLHCLQTRILKRRTYLSDILSYLKYGHTDAPGCAEGYILKITRASLSNRIKEIYDAYATPPIEVQGDDEDEENNNTEVSQSLLYEVGLKNELSLAINYARNFKASQQIGNAQWQVLREKCKFSKLQEN